MEQELIHYVKNYIILIVLLNKIVKCNKDKRNYVYI